MKQHRIPISLCLVGILITGLILFNEKVAALLGPPPLSNSKPISSKTPSKTERGDPSTPASGTPDQSEDNRHAENINTLRTMLLQSASPEEILAFFEGLSRSDWMAFSEEYRAILESLHQQHENKDLLPALFIFVQLWSDRDHLEALAWFESISKLQLDFDYDVYQSIPLFAWMRKDPDGFASQMEERSEESLQEIEQGVAEPLAEHYLGILAKLFLESGNADQWIEWIDELQLDGNEHTVVSALAGTATHATGPLIEPMAEKLAHHAHDRRLASTIPEFSYAYANEQPVAALEWMEELPAERRHASIQYAFKTLSVDHPEEALSWLNQDDVILRIGTADAPTGNLAPEQVYDQLVTTYLTAAIDNAAHLPDQAESIHQSIEAVSNEELRTQLTDSLNAHLQEN